MASRACRPARGAPFTHCNPCRAGPLRTIVPPIETTQGTASGVRTRSTARTRAARRRSGATRTRIPRPFPRPSRDVQDVAGSRSRTAAGSAWPSRVATASADTGTGRSSAYGGGKSRETMKSPARPSLAPPPGSPDSSGKQPAPGIPRDKSGWETPAGPGQREHRRVKAVEVAQLVGPRAPAEGEGAGQGEPPAHEGQGSARPRAQDNGRQESGAEDEPCERGKRRALGPIDHERDLQA